MPISFSCECGKNLKVRDEDAGKKVNCPACQLEIEIPFESVKPTLKAEVDEEVKKKPKIKKKKKRQRSEDDAYVGSMTKEEYEDWRDHSRNRMFYAKRLIYIIAGIATIVISIIAAGIFLVNGMDGIYPMGTCACGLLGGGYVVFQGITGTFHER